MDDDEIITSVDSLLILRRILSLEQFTDSQKIYADVNGDGIITSADALEVLRASVELPTKGNIRKKIFTCSLVFCGSCIHNH
ncbi:MAG: dockerin type I domain-containing protein [Acutalibacteraceae bacterium]|nr:dockerin type I domain-containing protein [Acutalibacteraceae bacterium]